MLLERGRSIEFSDTNIVVVSSRGIRYREIVCHSEVPSMVRVG